MKRLNDYKWQQWFYVSNLLSLIRIPLGFCFIYYLFQMNVLAMVIIAVVGILSDYGDGYFARKFNQVTELGIILDPIADKIAIGITVVGLMIIGMIPIWLVGFVLGRDVLILLGVAYMSRQNYNKKVEIPMSNITGKIAVNVIVTGLLLQITGDALWMEIGQGMVVVAVVCSIVSYAKRLRKTLLYS